MQQAHPPTHTPSLPPLPVVGSSKDGDASPPSNYTVDRVATGPEFRDAHGAVANSTHFDAMLPSPQHLTAIDPYEKLAIACCVPFGWDTNRHHTRRIRVGIRHAPSRLRSTATRSRGNAPRVRFAKSLLEGDLKADGRVRAISDGESNPKNRVSEYNRGLTRNRRAI